MTASSLRSTLRGISQRFFKSHIRDLTRAQSDHSIKTAARREPDSGRAITSRQPTVKCGWRTASLQMAEHGHARLKALLFNILTYYVTNAA